MDINFKGFFKEGFKNGPGRLETKEKIFIGNFEKDFKHGSFDVIDK